MATTTTTIRAKAFSGHGLETVRVQIEQDGTARVYDGVAGHYTACHSLSERDQQRARRKARTGR